MSYSNDVKNELTRLELETDVEKTAQLAGLVRVDGTILIGGRNSVALEIVSENAAVARQAFAWLKELFHVQAQIHIEQRTKLKKNKRYIVYVPAQDKIKTLLVTLGMISDEGLFFRSDIAHELISQDVLRRAYLRGVFLGSGSLTNPQRSYHIEIVTQSEEYAAQLVQLVANYGISMRTSYRKENIVVYLKESEQISDFLALIGAHEAVMSLENIRIQKGMRNQVNRLVNCETANMNKSVDAAMRQCNFIRYIAEYGNLQALSPSLLQAAEARLVAPEASLKELGEMMDPPIGKSGINHRMRRLEEVANAIYEDLGGDASEDVWS